MGLAATVLLAVSAMKLLTPNENARENELLSAINKLNESILDLHAEFSRIKYALAEVTARPQTLETELHNHPAKQTGDVAGSTDADTTGLPSYSGEEAMLLLPGTVTSPPNQIRPNLPDLAQELAQAKANATPEQDRIYVEIKNRLEDPDYLQALDLRELTESEEVQSLPEGYQKMIYGIALEKYNTGEANRDAFFMQNTQQN